MIPIHVDGATHRFGAPEGWDHDKDGRCTGLSVRQDGDVFVSAWELTPGEIEAVLKGAPIILRVFGGQPPVMLTVGSIAEPYGEKVEAR